MPGYMSVYSWVSPAMAALRLSRVSPMGSPVAGSPTAFQVLEVPVSVAGLAFGGGAKHRRNVIEPFDVGLLCEIQVTPVGLRFPGERILEILLRLAAFEIHDAPRLDSV